MYTRDKKLSTTTPRCHFEHFGTRRGHRIPAGHAGHSPPQDRGPDNRMKQLIIRLQNKLKNAAYSEKQNLSFTDFWLYRTECNWKS